MEKESAIVTVEPEKVQETVHLVATNPEQMAQSQSFLKTWLENKVAEMDHEYQEVADALEVAQRSKWGTSALRSQISRTKGRLIYYQKLLTAVNAGFTIVPNFPLEIFAVRTMRETPKYQISEMRNPSSWSDPARNLADEKHQSGLAVGQGRYVSPTQEVERAAYKTTDENNKEIVVKQAWPSDFKDVNFPLVAARPQVMSATAQAMMLKVFDSVGICPPRRKGDPLIIGKIFGPKIGYTQKEVSFLIAWYLDVRVL